MITKKKIGAHVSIAGGVQQAPLNATAIGASAFGLFVKNQRQWKAGPLSDENIRCFAEHCARYGFSFASIVAHDSYLINLGHPQADGLAKSRNALLDEVRRCEQLGIQLINIHPGSHLHLIKIDRCLQRIAASINHVLDKTHTVKILLENTAGQGSNLGYEFEQLAEILSQVEDSSRIGVCLDTCHAFASGYDFRDPTSYASTWKQFDQIIGRDRLYALHVNDAKSAFNSRVDRHAAIGQGYLGLEAFSLLMNDPQLDGLPMILETPNSEHWREEIQLLYHLQRGQHVRLERISPPPL
ncbi:deoxyribonuclease IV [bacterium]|nr:deoxyribonuclease IV [bacterium]